ncbi:isoquinoline 1-oxidoreductase, alpha subunit [Pseudomonas migulae]|uniref:Isoquinoline 1-oxidoreductase, alpha subunit n=5 Tax=Pseudomonas fluorescens group TaxID=136843 RepID=A0A1H5JY36_9PSED|nr:isoquinoline 1-oxidoreductase alpha subunit [Pseudomonas sp. SJZ080]SEE57330.1 isoquinoline 1-oxidoreductase, alpha subunit [Pseudomonas migulae]
MLVKASFQAYRVIVLHEQASLLQENNVVYSVTPLQNTVSLRKFAMLTLNINGKDQELDVPADMPLLWVLRDVAHLTGTKFGCGMAQCGACTVHVDGAPLRSCITPATAVAHGQKILTIEGLSTDGSHPVQQAWAELDVVQCGYCQSGQIMSAAALLAKIPKPTDSDIDQALSGNICRCGTYPRIRAAVKRAAEIG